MSLSEIRAPSNYLQGCTCGVMVADIELQKHFDVDSVVGYPLRMV